MARAVAVLLLLGAFCTANAQLRAALPGALPGAVPAAGAGRAGAAGAGVKDPCALGITFFPRGGESKPTGWTQAVQANAGNTAQDQMIKIAMAGYPIPQLYMAPMSVFTEVNGKVPGQCIGGPPGVLTRPAVFTITYAIAGTGGTIGPFTKGSKQDPPANVTMPIVPRLPDGEYCVQIKMDILPGSGIASVGSQSVRVPATAQSVVRQVCFMKLANRPTANVTFHSCNTSFAVDLGGITPKPTFARYPDMQLTSTVFHVWGKLNRTFDRSAQGENLLDYFDQYVKWTDPSKPNFLQVFMDSPGLVNGFYNVWIEGSLATNYPDLTNLFGLDQYDDGSAKYMGVSLRNNSNRPVPIQTVRSKIAELAGPDVPTPIGGAATFTWETQGYGEQFCYVDGQKVANTADMLHCESPLNLAVRDNANHTLEVVLADVCGEVVANGIFFGGWGWRQNMKFAPPAPPPPAPEPVFRDTTPALPMRAPLRSNRTTSGAAAVRPAVSISSSMVAAVLMGLGMVLLL
jgi:hypothetical protein